MIVCALGYGYLSKFVFQRLCQLGIIGIGISSQKFNDKFFFNTKVFGRKTSHAISLSSHLLVTAAPVKEGCPIINKYENLIARSNIKSVVYISSTGVYGNHNGGWVNENDYTKAKSIFDKRRLQIEKSGFNFAK